MVSDEADTGDGNEVSIGLFICWAELVVIDGVSIALFWPSPALGESSNVKQPAVIYESLFGSEGHFRFSLVISVCLYFYAFYKKSKKKVQFYEVRRKK